MVTLLNDSPSVAAPLKRPAGCACVTIPEAAALFGITTLSPTTTGSASVASKGSFSWLVFEPTADAMLTVNAVPDGTTIVAAGLAAVAGGCEPPVAPEFVLDDEGLLEHAASANTNTAGIHPEME